MPGPSRCLVRSFNIEQLFRALALTNVKLWRLSAKWKVLSISYPIQKGHLSRRTAQHAPVLHGLGHMADLGGGGARQIGNGARHLQRAVRAAG